MTRNPYTFAADGPFSIRRVLPILESAKKDGIITEFKIEESGRRHLIGHAKLGDYLEFHAFHSQSNEAGLKDLIKDIQTFLPRTLDPKDILRRGDQWRGVHIPWTYVDPREFGSKVGPDPDGRIQFRRIII